MRPWPHADSPREIAPRIRGKCRTGKIIADLLQHRNRMQSCIRAWQLLIQHGKIPKRGGQPRIARIPCAPILERVLYRKCVVRDCIWFAACVMEIICERKDQVTNAERAEAHVAEVFIGRRKV